MQGNFLDMDGVLTLLTSLIAVIYTVIIYFKKAYYIFHVIGDSMLPSISNGEKLLVKKTRKIKKGDVVIARVDYPINNRYNKSPVLVVKRVGNIDKKLGDLFLLGDNSESSIDSRDEKFGIIEPSRIKGKVLINISKI